MVTKSEQATERVIVGVSPDRMEAWIKLADADDPRPLTSEEIMGVLREEHVALNDDVRKKIEAFRELVAGEEERPERFVIASGRVSEEGRDGEFIWDESFRKQAEDWQGDARVDYYSLNSIVTVDKEAVIGRVIAAVKGTDGVDVCGKSIPPRRRPVSVKIDSSVVLGGDDGAAEGSPALAAVPGKVVYEDGELSISEVFTINGDVNFGTGNVDSSVDVHITGTVQDLFTVKSAKSISVCGAIEAAELVAEADVIVRGGILGRGKGSVTANGELVARFCDEAELRAKGDIKITKELMNTRVRCESTCLVAHGAVIGGELYAREGLEVGTLGSEAFVPTSVTIGIHPDVIREAAKIEEEVKSKREACERIRQAVQPLMHDMKRLSAEQKERATELLFKADEIELEIEETEQRRKELLSASRATGVPYVLISKVVYPGARIRIGRRHSIFQKELKGPVKVEKRKVENVTEFVSVNQLTGSITVMASAYLTDEEAGETGKATERGTCPGHG